MRYDLLLAAIILTVTADVASAAEPASLDLVCTGQTVAAGGAPQPFATRLSVDLKSKRWCDQQVGCPFVFPVLARHGDDLQLLAVKTALNEAAFDVDLRTGAFTRTTRIPDRPDSSTAAKGMCKPAPFTPFS